MITLNYLDLVLIILAALMLGAIAVLCSRRIIYDRWARLEEKELQKILHATPPIRTASTLSAPNPLPVREANIDRIHKRDHTRSATPLREKSDRGEVVSFPKGASHAKPSAKPSHKRKP